MPSKDASEAVLSEGSWDEKWCRRKEKKKERKKEKSKEKVNVRPP